MAERPLALPPVAREHDIWVILSNGLLAAEVCLGVNASIAVFNTYRRSRLQPLFRMENACLLAAQAKARAMRARVSFQPEEDLMSINDNLPSSSPSGKTMLRLLAAVLALVVLIALYYKTIGF